MLPLGSTPSRTGTRARRPQSTAATALAFLLVLLSAGIDGSGVLAQEQAPGAPPAQEPAAADTAAGVGTISMQIDPTEGTVGERLRATLTVQLPADAELEAPTLGPMIGSFNVDDESWAGPTQTDDGWTWVWSADLSIFRTGDLEVPPVTLSILRDEATLAISSEAVPITIKSVLAEEDLAEGEPDLSDLKPPVSVAPDYGPLKAALGVLLALLIASLVAWWLYRRYADRLAAAEVPEDPFHRVPPHVWVYGELQKLLERRLAEEGQVDEFYSELAHILKRYLGGRYRVELLEQTTEELPASLQQAGCPTASIHDTEDMLREADGVKFAKVRPGPTHWKAAVDLVYRIVDRTKPVEVATDGAADGPAQPGADGPTPPNPDPQPPSPAPPSPPRSNAQGAA